MHGLQLVKKLKAQFANMFRMLLIVFKPARKAARSHKQLASGAIITMRFLAGKSLVRDFLEKAFADADSRDRKEPQIQIAPQREKRDGGDAHDVGAVAAHPVGLHALTRVALENVRQTFAQERKLDGLEAVFTRTRGDFG